MYVCVVKNLGLGHDLPRSAEGIVISPFCEGSIFTKIKPSQKFRKFVLAKILYGVKESEYLCILQQQTYTFTRSC